MSGISKIIIGKILIKDIDIHQNQQGQNFSSTYQKY